MIKKLYLPFIPQVKTTQKEDEGKFVFQVFISLPHDSYNVDVYAVETSFENTIELLFFGRVPYEEAFKMFLYEWLLVHGYDSGEDLIEADNPLLYINYNNKFYIDENFYRRNGFDDSGEENVLHDDSRGSSE